MDVENWAEQKKLFGKVFETKTRDEWCEIFQGTDACFAPRTRGMRTGIPTLYLTQHRKPNIKRNARALYHRKPIKKDANIIVLNYLVASKAMVGLSMVKSASKFEKTYLDFRELFQKVPNP